LSFNPAELREAAYVRRSIENDVFKKPSRLAGTKRFHFKDSSAFLSVLRILCAAVTAFELVEGTFQGLSGRYSSSECDLFLCVFYI
jgi:hypothetical protein